MQTLAALCLIADLSGTTLVLLLTIPAIRTILESVIQRFHGADQYLCEFYVDQDGEADRTSIISAEKKVLRILIIIFVIGGVMTALVRLLVYEKMFALDLWAQFLVWALSHVATINSIGWEAYVKYKTGRLNHAHLYLMCLEMGFAFLSVACDLSLPQRPDVFRNGKVVDRERTASLLSRMTFGWTTMLIRLASRKNDIHTDHLPELDSETRAKNLQESFAQAQAQVISNGGSSKSLWQVLWRSYHRHLLWQFALSLPASLLAFGPHVSLLRILQILEKQSEGGMVTADLWLWVLVMGVSLSLSSWLEAFIGWIASNKIAICVYEQLSAVLFSKSMRSNRPTDRMRKRDNLQSAGQDEVNQGTQVAVNLVAVDVPRIAGIATFLYNFLLVPLKLGVACVLLQQVLGWRSLFAGMAALALLMLLNHVCMAKYTKAGKDLMICRDRKVITLTEALRGIRQIKFSATEDQWGERLSQLRTAELRAQATSFRWNVICFSVWVLAPILLSVASLSVYTINHGGLTPSVAFTAISALTSMEVALSVLPELITNAMDAIISMKRIGEFLDAPEKISTTIASTSICFDNATVAWSGSISGNGSPSETAFVLRNLNAHFPRHGLSLVCGRTGAGKSLLLATILGESEVLDGQVKRPARETSRGMYDISGRTQEWIIESVTAYIAQVPWIEAATIRENVLFGLPFDGQRYRKVLYACALVQDLQILDDGDLTEVGPNGVNLSGGQKARIALARGLYSRAGILIMDDIFSAVDVHTAQHLYEHALTGELATGRTRILATHHMRLCLPRVDYLVNLDSGSMIFAGSVAEIQRSGALDGLLGRTIGVHEELGITTNSASSKCLDQSTPCRETSRIRVANPPLKHRPRRPKQFVEEEGREKGAIAFSVFHRYVQKCGGRLKWVMLALCFTSYTGLVLGKVNSPTPR
ncbi:ATP-dependent bile acid permease [Aspergillus clavatus NRRL 1]|uniref:ATP-dependent bile acid permease n=1 Tax=Aspergillus clavatus (strain ATCC 1007 / CBS 513.65 / DSM 816 / NCTC 3887 / NRRL 1 / QM 1276 / 107) TaxID=344612 RepID=A1CAP1_ASPCL|nr:ATP-dependent bile acid permease [Aspergillus clavatus NRRL 1]EAW12809.1 ATP-dependent bile acid permease [Aspergillus clavatus NRRL 1]